MNLYHVQDSDRPMFIAAKSWQQAVEKWQAQLCKENDGDFVDEQPTGIHLVAENRSESFPEYIP